jgi:hypothetical protein
MLQLYWTNLEVRLQASTRKLCPIIRGRSSRRSRTCGRRSRTETDAGPEWDEIYKIERLSALLFNGAQLRQEIAQASELADQNVPGPTASGAM